MYRISSLLTTCIFALVFISCQKTEPLKVYILTGQSNMQGSAHKSTFDVLGDDPSTAPLLEKIISQDGGPVTAENTWITYKTNRGGRDTVIQGKLKVGYGFDENRIGPEYAFGLFMEEAHDERILIIKTAWGGKSLAVDFRSPGAGSYIPNEQQIERGNFPEEEEVGFYYRQMMQHIRETLNSTESIRAIVPGYDEKAGYEISGFVWFQGWNDLVNRYYVEQYTENMIHFIYDVRKELDEPKLPFIVGVLGVYGADPDNRKYGKTLPLISFREAQFAAVEQYNQKVPDEYHGNIKAVDSGPFYEQELSDIYWKRRLTNEWKRNMSQGKMTEMEVKELQTHYGFDELGLTPEEQAIWDREASNAEYHYLGSGKTFIRFGKALADTMQSMEVE